MRRFLITCVVALAVAQCTSRGDDGSNSHAASCSASPDVACANFCGSDVIEMPVCIDGAWHCPPGSVNAADCPPGTCFGFSMCCGPNGEHASKICPVGGTPGTASGHCPDGYYDCQFGSGNDGGADADALAPIDAAAGVAECLTMGYSCTFCCDKYFWDDMVEYDKTLHDCACASSGPCAAACADNGFCTDPTYGPSSTCEPCLLAQRTPNTPCAAGVTACNQSATCKPYLACLESCGG